jgi:Omp85 superfamily domain
MRLARPLLLTAALGALSAAHAPAQAPGDTVRAVAGPRYRAGPLKRLLLGRSYRTLWTTPVAVPVLDLSTFAGGLTPTETGGGNQTLSLRFRGADGREYAFRAVDKEPGRGRKGGTGVAGYFLQDQVSSQNPAGALVAARLMDATGALHVHPQLFVMPDDPRLGEYREPFAGMLGQVEERPHDGFGGFPELEDTEGVLAALLADPRDRVAAEELLTVRLMDVFLGDWDRHEDQYEWALAPRADGTRLWRPLPRDRDYVFVDYDGLLLDAARPFLEKAVRFRPGYGRGVVYGLIEQGQYLDRRLLGGLDRADWDSAASALRARLTDALIDDAVRRQPAEYQALEGARLASVLRRRRDRLPAAAADFYRMMAGEPEAHGTDGPDLAVVERGGDALEVRIHAGGSGSGAVLFRRRFVAGETREVRIYLHGGDDRAEVRGTGGILVRVLGGAGDDRMEDRGRGARTVFYDDEGDDRFVRGAHTVVDTRSYAGRDTLRMSAAADPPRDWGTREAELYPLVDVRPFADLVVGLGPGGTRYGFRRDPFATQWYARALWAPLYGRFGAEGRYARRWTGSPSYGYLFARASALEGAYFTGFGNDTHTPQGARRYVVWERQALLEPGVMLVRPGGVSLNLAGVLRYTDPELRGGTPADDTRPPGTDPFLAAGGRAAALVDRRDDIGYPTRGFTLGATAELVPLVTDGLSADVDGGFARTGAAAAAYLPLGPAVLAVRAGGEKVFGDFPLQYSAFLGGSPSLRGFSYHRFAGDAAAFGSAEVRMRVAGSFGVLGLADAGRVWYGGDSDGGWHTAYGGGAFVTTGGRSASAFYAQGERGILYLRLGLPF